MAVQWSGRASQKRVSLRQGGEMQGVVSSPQPGIRRICLSELSEIPKQGQNSQADFQHPKTPSRACFSGVLLSEQLDNLNTRISFFVLWCENAGGESPDGSDRSRSNHPAVFSGLLLWSTSARGCRGSAALWADMRQSRKSQINLFLPKFWKRYKRGI